MTFPEIRPAREDELTAVGALISYSFDELAADSYLVPNEADRLRVMADFFTLLTEHAYRYGRVDVIDAPPGSEEAYAAAAVWFDLTQEAPGPERYEERLEELAGEYLPRFQALDELFEKHHPTDPHWHLAFLAVHPAHQAHGLGSLLMKDVHEELDQAGTPAYLEATNANNIRLYKRHGYTEMEPFEILLPDGTPFARMWRAAS